MTRAGAVDPTRPRSVPNGVTSSREVARSCARSGASPRIPGYAPSSRVKKLCANPLRCGSETEAVPTPSTTACSYRRWQPASLSASPTSDTIDVCGSGQLACLKSRTLG